MESGKRNRDYFIIVESAIFIHELKSIGKRTSERTSEFSDTLQRVNKNRTCALSMMLFVYFIGTEISLRIFVRRKLGFEGPQSSGLTSDKISLVKKRRSPNQQRER